MAVPQTIVRTSHALTIKVNNTTIGMINGWSPAQGRTITPIFELGTDKSGNVVENMPGNINGLAINVNRYDTYKRRMEQVFGTSDLIMLTRQSQPFTVMEIWNNVRRVNPLTKVPGITENALNILSEVVPIIESASPAEINQERFIYTGCWFSSIGRTLSSDDNRIVNVNATLIYTEKLKLTEALVSAKFA